VEARIAESRETHADANETFNEVQGRYYSSQSEISRLEQSLAHARENRERQQEERAQAEAQLAELESEIHQDREQLTALITRLEELAPDLQQARSLEETSAANLQRVEEALDSWQTAWHDFNLEAKEYQQTCQVERTRIEHLESQAQRLRQRQDELNQEGQGISVADAEAALLGREREEASAAAEVEQRTAASAELDRRIAGLREREQELGGELEALSGALESRRGRAETLEAVQAAALGADEEAASRWLARAGLADQPRLAQRLRVEAPWERAVETVLGDFLQAVCVRRPEERLASLPEADIALLDDLDTDTVAGPGFLAAKVSGAGRAAQLLAHVRVADTLDGALALQPSLAAGETVITPEGIWLGDGWVRVSRGHHESGGVIAREQDIRTLHTEIKEHELQVSRLQSERTRIRGELQQLEAERLAAGEALTAANRRLAECHARLANLREDLDRVRSRLQSLTDDGRAVRDDREGLEEAMRAAQARLQQAEEAMARMTDRRPTLERQQQELLEEYNRAREQAEMDRENAARIEIEYESRRASKESASTTLTRVQGQRTRLHERVAALGSQIDGSDGPVADMQAALDTQLADKVNVEQELAARRRALEEADHGLREAETARAECERQVAAVREAADELRMLVREIEVRREGLSEQFRATDRTLEQVKSDLPGDANMTAWEEELARVQRRIERLGAINLAAIDEFAEQSERKEYLDSQFEDLSAALDTLEKAIRKIDRETRTRFQETFEQINTGLKRIFPRLFGGGHAYLSLDGEDLLSAGVTVMAQPPGKRNSHIHLLSGGEKALTAVALIFSIFELNPAPFCLLDEVDAPLDDANVGRFCEIVREMSDTVQFIVITHNKTTMELARQLTGVTMNEPGVSRLVSVDIDEAVKLAAS
jgi:chromosome segregation protein